MTTTSQLKHWATCHSPLYNNAKFIGVFPSDRLPDPESVASRAPAALIVNYDPADLPGSHWCSILVTRRAVWWFDSYGLPPDAPDLILGHKTHFHQWLARVCEQLSLPAYSWNAADLQSLGEQTCGHWAAYFVKKRPEKWVGYVWVQPSGQQRLNQAFGAAHLNSLPSNGPAIAPRSGPKKPRKPPR